MVWVEAWSGVRNNDLFARDELLHSSHSYRVEDCHLEAPGSIPASAKSKLHSLNITHIDGYIMNDK